MYFHVYLQSTPGHGKFSNFYAYVSCMNTHQLKCDTIKNMEKKKPLTFPSFFNLMNVAESPTTFMVLIAATGVCCFMEIIAFLDENCKKQLDFRARPINMRITEILHEIKHKSFQLKGKKNSTAMTTISLKTNIKINQSLRETKKCTNAPTQPNPSTSTKTTSLPRVKVIPSPNILQLPCL